MNHNSTSDIRSLLEAHGIGLKKRFGQNFLVNASVRERIVDAIVSRAPEAGGAVWEIGPGLGSITDLLVHHGYALRLFEIDRGLVSILEERYGERVPVVVGDAVTTLGAQWEMERTAADSAPVIVGNLPYHSASAIVAAIVESAIPAPTMVFLVQKEMADRMRAAVGSADYSAFSVLTQLHYRTEKLFDVPGSAFYPRPHVGSTVIACHRRGDAPDRSLQQTISRITRQAFAQRRKTLRNTIGAYGDVLAAAGIDPSLRAEVLSPDQFRDLGTRIMRR